MRWIFLLAAVVWSAPTQAQTIVDDPKDIERTLAEQVAADVAEEFADPIAVQVRKLHKSPTHADSICGQVNAKNAYGGYVGFKPFRYIIERRKIYFVHTGCN